MVAPWRNSGYLAGEHPWKLMAAGMGGRAWSVLPGGASKSLPPRGEEAASTRRARTLFGMKFGVFGSRVLRQAARAQTRQRMRAAGL